MGITSRRLGRRQTGEHGQNDKNCDALHELPPGLWMPRERAYFADSFCGPSQSPPRIDQRAPYTNDQRLLQ